MAEKESRFVDREMTVREMIYLSKAGQNDFESQVLLIESRLKEPIVNLRDWPISDFNVLSEECMEGIGDSAKMTRALGDIAKASR